jgi:hypothetical protein
MPIIPWKNRKYGYYSGVSAGGETIYAQGAEEVLLFEAGDNVALAIGRGPDRVIVSVPRIPAEDIEGLIQNGQIAGLSASKLIGLVQDGQIAGMSAEKLIGLIQDSQIAGVGAEKLIGLIAKEQIASVDSGVIEWGGFDPSALALSFDHLTPHIAVRDSAAAQTFTEGGHVAAGMTIEILNARHVALFASVNARRVRGTFDLFIAESGQRIRDIVTNVRGNDGDPRTSFTAFHFGLTPGNYARYQLGVAVSGTGGSMILDGYSVLAMHF